MAEGGAAEGQELEEMKKAAEDTVKLYCGMYPEAKVVNVEIPLSAEVELLQEKIFSKRGYEHKYKFVASDLTLRLAKKGEQGEWIKVDKHVREFLRKRPDSEFEEMWPSLQLSDYVGGDLGKGVLHVLVELPVDESTATKDEKPIVRKRALEEYFGDKKKKQRVEGDDTMYLEMNSFPEMAHAMPQYKKILERRSYVVIFRELMTKVNSHLVNKSSANLIVTGNPGIGKSRFYLYCIYHLVQPLQRSELPSFELVLNYGSKYQKYDPVKKEFVHLRDDEVDLLSQKTNVLRLVEATSSRLVGWLGVSILFSSPGLPHIDDFKKVNIHSYILPVWNWEELQKYNSLLADDLKLQDEVLISRYSKFGGIPRYIFTVSEEQVEFDLGLAIRSFNALDVISFIRKSSPVKDDQFSHRMLQMVPMKDDFSTSYYLDFLSKDIADRVVAATNDQSLQEVSAFAVAHDNDDSGCTAVARGKIYEMLCHRWFTLSKQKELRLRSLSSPTDPLNISIPENMQTVRFSSLLAIRQVNSGWTYYRPKGKTFGALDAFIVDGGNGGGNVKCYGLQMTINLNRGIKASPLNAFLKQLNDIGILTDNFFLFVTPSKYDDSFTEQTIRTATGKETQRPGKSADVEQFVAALDGFVN